MGIDTVGRPGGAPAKGRRKMDPPPSRHLGLDGSSSVVDLRAARLDARASSDPDWRRPAAGVGTCRHVLARARRGPSVADSILRGARAAGCLADTILRIQIGGGFGGGRFWTEMRGLRG